MGDNEFGLKRVADQSFHCTSCEFAEAVMMDGVHLSKGRAGLDFNSSISGNRAFYMTKVKQQAMDWGKRRGNPFGLIVFIGTIPAETVYSFPGYLDWADSVVQGRLKRWQHTHDFVEGPFLLNPGCVRWFEQEALLPSHVLSNNIQIPSRCVPIPWGHQLATCTERAAKHVNQLQRHLEVIVWD